MSRWARRLGLVLAAVLACFGVAETIAHLDDPGSLPFWSGCLFGGAALVLVGTLWHPPDRPFLPLALLVPGAVLGAVPTVWTLLLPVLAFATITVSLLDAAQRHDAAQA